MGTVVVAMGEQGPHTKMTDPLGTACLHRSVSVPQAAGSALCDIAIGQTL